MSLLLKALKQAETAHAEKNTPDTDWALESLEPDPAKAREWLEPPGMLFGNNGLTPAPAKPSRMRMPRLSLVPATALLAGIVALGYGMYLYFELKPPAAVVVQARLAPVTGSIGLPVETPAPAPLPVATPIAPEITVPPSPSPTLPEVTVLAQPPRAQPGGPAMSAPRAPVTMPRTARSEVDSRQAVEPYSFQPDSGNRLLNNAYDAYQHGQLDEAHRWYTQAAARERSVDALLGLAAIAGVRNRDEEATRLYREVLDRDPHNAAAQAALLDLLGNTDRQATESRLKSLIDRAPSAGLYQTLGNVYAEQNRWGDAQTAYFEAFRMAPSNADYAFNLAVSLDRLHQPLAALGYYEKALTLGGNPRFDRAQTELRIRQIKAVQP